MKTALEWQADRDLAARQRVALEEAADQERTRRLATRLAIDGLFAELRELADACWCLAPPVPEATALYWMRHRSGWGDQPPSPACGRAKACRAEDSHQRRNGALNGKPRLAKVGNAILAHAGMILAGFVISQIIVTT